MKGRREATLRVRNDLCSENCLHNIMYTSMCVYFIASRSSTTNEFIFLPPPLPLLLILLYLIIFSKLSHTLVSRWRNFLLHLFLRKFTFFSLFILLECCSLYFFIKFMINMNESVYKDGSFMSQKRNKSVHS